MLLLRNEATVCSKAARKSGRARPGLPVGRRSFFADSIGRLGVTPWTGNGIGPGARYGAVPRRCIYVTRTGPTLRKHKFPKGSRPLRLLVGTVCDRERRTTLLGLDYLSFFVNLLDCTSYLRF